MVRRYTKINFPRSKRSLNSYMAFRAYYNPLFNFMEQKDASVFISMMWDRECNKDAWQIIAKSYSLIRDAQGLGESPLEQYLEFAVKEVHVVPRDKYIQVYGYDCTIFPTKFRMIFRGHSNPIPAPRSGMSVGDLLLRSREIGYLKEDYISETLEDAIYMGNGIASQAEIVHRVFAIKRARKQEEDSGKELVVPLKKSQPVTGNSPGMNYATPTMTFDPSRFYDNKLLTDEEYRNPTVIEALQREICKYFELDSRNGKPVYSTIPKWNPVHQNHTVQQGSGPGQVPQGMQASPGWAF